MLILYVVCMLFKQTCIDYDENSMIKINSLDEIAGF